MVRHLVLLLAGISLLGCASLEGKPPTQAQGIQRLSDEELARIMPPPVSQLSFDALVSMSKTGLTPAQMMDKLKETDTSYDLTASQILSLNKQGVPVEVLDYLHTRRAAAVQNNIAESVSQHEKVKNEEIQKLKRQLQLSTMDPFCRNGFPGYYPYGIRPHFRSGFGFGISSPWYY
jgi:hypothetical protein